MRVYAADAEYVEPDVVSGRNHGRRIRCWDANGIALGDDDDLANIF